MKSMVLVLAAVLLFAGRVPALETLAYRFVGEPECKKPLAQYPAVEHAPDATPFVSAGDALRDLTPSIRATKVPLKDGWVLWNATRRLLTIHGAMTDQWRISTRLGFYRQALNCQVNVEWLRTADANHPPADTDAPFASVAVLTPSGRKGTASTTIEAPDGEWKFEVEAAPDHFWYGMTGMSLYAAVKGPGDKDGIEGELCLNLRQADGKSRTVASWFAGESNGAWWVRVKSDSLLADGSSWHEGRLRQTGDKSGPWPTATPTEPTVTLPHTPGGHLSVLTIDGRTIRAWVRPNDTEGATTDSSPGDPFAEQNPNVVPYSPLDLPEAPIPDWLRDIAAPPLCDLRPTIAKCGVQLAEDELLAYDFGTGRLVCGCRNPEEARMVKSLFTGLCPGYSDEIEYETWLEGAAAPGRFLARVSLICLSGTRSYVEWKGAKESSSAISLAGEFGSEHGEGIIADTSFSGNLPKRNGKGMGWKINAPARLRVGIPSVIEALRLPDGRTVRRGQKSVAIPEVR